MVVEQELMNMVMGATAIILAVLLYIAYLAFRTKRMLKRAIENEQPKVQGY